MYLDVTRLGELEHTYTGLDHFYFPFSLSSPDPLPVSGVYLPVLCISILFCSLNYVYLGSLMLEKSHDIPPPASDLFHLAQGLKSHPFSYQ